MKCPRCTGLIIHPVHYNDDDPKCSSCSRLYPYLKIAAPEGNGGPKRGLSETIRYTGSIELLKEKTCIINYKPHPSPSVPYPLLEISCPWCTKIAKAENGTTNPAAARRYKTKTDKYSKRWSSKDSKNNKGIYARVGDTDVQCPTGHLFRLKITGEGVYSWE